VAVFCGMGFARFVHFYTPGSYFRSVTARLYRGNILLLDSVLGEGDRLQWDSPDLVIILLIAR
jgi:hypothetical protein